MTTTSMAATPVSAESVTATSAEPPSYAESATGSTSAANEAPAATAQSQTNVQARGTRLRKSGRSASAGPIEQAVALRAALRDSISKTNELIRSLKRQRQQNRLVQSTLASLKQLQQAG